MAEALTYDSLVSDIQLYAERTDDPFVTQIPRFIMLAENRLASEAKGLGFLKVATLTVNSATFEKPARWRETLSFMITTSIGVRFLYSRDYTYCRIYWPDQALTGIPKFYADYDYTNFLVVPTPNLTYNAELAYYERPDPLSTLNQTNWTTEYAPQLLLYACLLEAQPFLKLQERIPEFQAMYDRALAGLKGEDVSRLSDSSSNRGQ
jgi:hypothetical protein